MSSIIHQVNQCVREIDRIGVSKKKVRNEGIKAIHSHKTKKEVLKIGKQFARWGRENHGIKNLHEFKEQHYLDFLASKSNTTLDYRRSIETHLRLVQEGLNKRSDRLGKDRAVFIPKKRLIKPRGRLEGVSNRSYSERDVQAIRGRVTPAVARSIALMRNLGLRVGESVQLRAEHVQGDSIRIQDDTITKGGRDREIPVPPAFQKELQQMCFGKEMSERLVPLAAGTVMNEVKAACKKLNIKSNGTHGFRHSYARVRMNQLMNEEEKSLFSRCMERYTEGKNFDYGIHNKELYESMKNKMDQVHRELGHGKDRFDLAARYMR